MTHNVLGDVSNLYVGMQEDLDVRDFCSDIVIEVSLSMLSEGKSPEEVLEFFAQGDSDVVLEIYESLTLTEEVQPCNFSGELNYILERAGLLKAIRSGLRTIWKGKKVAPAAAKAAAPAAKSGQVTAVGRRIRIKRALPPAKGAAPATTGAAQAAKPGLGGKIKNFFTKGGIGKNILAGTIGFGAGMMVGKNQQPAAEPAEPETTTAPDKKPEVTNYDTVFPNGVPNYSDIFKDTKQPEPTKVEVPDEQEKKKEKAKAEGLPDRAPSQLGDKTPYSKAATEKMSLRTRRILSGQSVYNRDPRARAGYDPRYDRKTRKEAYDIVLDYLVSEGHVDTVDEAHYVMMQMDAEHIQSIVEAGEGRVNLTYPAGHPKYGQPMEVDGKPMSVSKRTADWNSKMNRYKEQNPEGYKKAKGMMGPYGWSEPPKGYNPPNWM